MRNIFLHIPQEGPAIKDQVLATVVRTEGSTPQKAGSSALFGSSGLRHGTVGGGILEGKVTEIASRSVKAKKSGLYRFTLDNNSPDGEDALCGGAVTVLIDADPGRHNSVFQDAGKSITARIPGVLVTIVSNIYDESVVIKRLWSGTMERDPLAASIMEVTGPVIEGMLKNPDPHEFRESEFVLPGEETASMFYFQSVIPPPHVIIAGAGHIGKALMPIVQMLGFEITVIDNRKEFANPGNLPAADHILVGDVGKALSMIGKQSDCFIVIVTRGHKDDAGALRACIGSEAAYIGMIGSKNKVALMKKEFISNKWATPEQWNRIFAPIGIDINSKTVEEIAVSISAQLVMVRNMARSAAEDHGEPAGIKSRTSPAVQRRGKKRK